MAKNVRAYDVREAHHPAAISRDLISSQLVEDVLLGVVIMQLEQSYGGYYQRKSNLNWTHTLFSNL